RRVGSQRDSAQRLYDAVRPAGVLGAIRVGGRGRRVRPPCAGRWGSVNEEMREGRELDVAMHTALFGTVHRVPEGKIIYTAVRDYVWGGGCYWYAEDGRPWELPHYSADIAAAWGVVERLRACGFTVDLLSVRSMGAASPDEWIVEITSPERGTTWREKRGAAPLAICRAAQAVASDGALRAPGGGAR